MDRRAFLSASAAATAGLSLDGLSRPALANGVKTLKMVTTWPKDYVGLGESASRLAARVRTMSGGRLSITVYAAGELVPAFEAFEAVANGTADLYHGAETYWESRSSAFNFFCAVPFGLTAIETSAWIHHGGAQALWDALSAPYGIKPMLASATGVQMGGWFNKEIKRVEDFKGLRMRIPGLGARILKELGALPVSLPGSQIHDALRDGAIDAAEWIGPWSDLALDLQKVARYYYYPGFHEPGTSLAVGVNLGVWRGLSDQERAIIEAACGAEHAFSLAEYNARNGDALHTLVTNHGVQLRAFPTQVLLELGKTAGWVVRAAAADSPETRRIYDHYIAFRRKALTWAQLSDQAFWNARSLPFEY
ncbi:ABC transporter substrate-binding protein [Rhodospirillum rubrum]|uniref:TRAP transporter substrate-binding protein n=1 Tax=Rhodospirillum rubrum TaxID=1085 RepID=UPI0019087DAE|nr:TRAP transporter substrate-binding protein [Rhodospirillum rubrum]MBK1664165.1 ABC transporter substrate-binding protein [Rhodospirillum rubrum]MBK1675814.1 ABC transporter substrate-binding protein [Rhodospirillum rubrum]